MARESGGFGRGRGSVDGGAAIEATFVDRQFEKDGGAWAKSRVTLEDGRTLTIVGPMLDPRPGAKIRLLSAQEKTHPMYGPQIAYRAYEWLGWEDLGGMKKYLADVCEGIGRIKAARLVDSYKEQATSVLKDGNLREVSARTGIDLDTLVEAREALLKASEFEKLQVILRGANFGPGRIGALTRRYGDRALEVLQSDPWKVALEVDGFGFKTADQVAMALGHSPDSPSRGRAGLAHFTHEACFGDGHIFVPAIEVGRLMREAGLTDNAIMHGMEWAQENGWLLTIGDKQVISPPRLAKADVSNAENILELMQGAPDVTWDEEAAKHISLDEFQQQALDLLKKNKVAIVTGGPGTGKTHLINALVRSLGGGSVVKILTPTGKAAARIKESGLDASTIHRAIGWGRKDEDLEGDDSVSYGFDKLTAKVVIVDECSMVDSALMAALIHAMDPAAALWVFGDADQLPPVGPGSPFADMIDSGVVPIARLKKIHRQNEQSVLAENCRRVNMGDLPRWGKNDAGQEIVDFFYAEVPNPEEAEREIVDIVARRAPGRFQVKPEEIQVLSPMNPRAAGVESLNEKLRDRLNPTGQKGPGDFRENDRVVHTRNNYTLGVMNGEVGKVIEVIEQGRHVDREIYVERSYTEEEFRAEIDPGRTYESLDEYYIATGHAPRKRALETVKDPAPKGGLLLVDFGDRRVMYDREDARDLKLAYAISIHKSQGSQFKVVVLPILKAHSFILSRRLLYTGISRARLACVLIGQEDGLRYAVKNVKNADRNTFMKARMIAATKK